MHMFTGVGSLPLMQQTVLMSCFVRAAQHLWTSCGSRKDVYILGDNAFLSSLFPWQTIIVLTFLNLLKAQYSALPITSPTHVSCIHVCI